MIRIAGLAAALALVSCGLAPVAATRDDTTLAATPAATPVATGPFEAPGAVPLSLLIENDGGNDRLLGGSTPVAASVALHQTRLINGRRVMEPLPEGIAVSAASTLILEPAGSHLMLVGLRVDLVQGETFPLILHFERAGDVTVSVRVRRKVDAAGVEPIPPVVVGDLKLSLASTPPAPGPSGAVYSSCSNRRQRIG